MVLIFFLQCISPGLVETEFAARLLKDDPEKAAVVYSKYKVKISQLHS